MNIHAMNPIVGLPPTTIQPLQCVRRSKSEQINKYKWTLELHSRSSTVWVVFVRLTYAASDYI